MIKKNIEFFVADFFFKIRCGIFSFLFKNKKDGYLKHAAEALKNLSHLGCYKIENFYSENQIDYINQIFNKTLDMVDTNQDSKLVIEKTTGEIKIKNIQEHFKGIKSLSSEMFLVLMSAIFNGKVKYANVLFDLVHDGSFNQKIVEGKSEERISGNYHFDDFKPIFKIVVLLDDVSEKIGAQTCIIPQSCHDKALKNFLFNKKEIDIQLIEEKKKKYGVYNCYGKKGDIFLMDTRNIHWGAKLNSGYRRVLWYYF